LIYSLIQLVLVDFKTTAVPAPSMFALMGLALLGLARRRTKA